MSRASTPGTLKRGGNFDNCIERNVSEVVYMGKKKRGVRVSVNVESVTVNVREAAHVAANEVIERAVREVIAASARKASM